MRCKKKQYGRYFYTAKDFHLFLNTPPNINNKSIIIWAKVERTI